jgi:PAS domain S-box-containing protein
LNAATNTPIEHANGAPPPAADEVQLLELGAHFAIAERAGQMGYWRQEIGSTQPHWSPGFFEMMGFDPRAVRPSSTYLIKRVHPDDRISVAQEIAEAMATGRPFYYRTRSWRLGNSERVFDTHGDVERSADGTITALLGVVRDVTQEVAAQRQLTESEATYRFMTDEATDVITRHGREGKPTFVSPAVKQMLGWSQDEVVGGSPFDRCHPDDLERVQAAVITARDSGSTVTYEYRARHKSGHFVWVESSVRFVANSETGELDSAISVTRDITKRKKIEDEMLAARVHAEAASHTKSRFLANMSHELRTPLNAIIGFSDIMVREMFGPIENAHYREYVKLVHESGGMLLDLINDLLDMSKIEAGKYELHYESFLVGDAVDSSLRLFEARAAEKGIKLSSSVEPGTLSVRADRRVFKQIILNLVSNATKFTNEGGNVCVEALATGTELHIKVRDTGIGIPKEFLPRLAEPFEQASNDPARTHGGTGLGLALVKSLVLLHGGRFGVASQQGHGTEVTVTLPLTPALDAVNNAA